jgi:hypothetical protein
MPGKVSPPLAVALLATVSCARRDAQGWPAFSPVVSVTAGAPVEMDDLSLPEEYRREPAGLAELDGRWHVALMTEDGLGLFPVDRHTSDPARVVPVTTNRPILMPSDEGLPWVVEQNEDGDTLARRIDAPFPPDPMIRRLGTVLGEPLFAERRAFIPSGGGAPRGVLGWSTYTGHGKDDERTVWITDASYDGRAGVPIRVGTWPNGPRRFHVVRSEAGEAVVRVEEEPGRGHALYAWRDGVETDEGPTGYDVVPLLTADGRLFVMSGIRGAHTVTVRQVGVGTRTFAVDGDPDAEDLALIECGGTVWGIVWDSSAEGHRLRVYDLGSDAAPLDLESFRATRPRSGVQGCGGSSPEGPLVAECGAGGAAVARTWSHWPDGATVHVDTWSWAPTALQ